ncbi:MAG: hypothetical protein ACLTT1_11025 [[Clostridium] scindens]
MRVWQAWLRDGGYADRRREGTKRHNRFEVQEESMAVAPKREREVARRGTWTKGKGQVGPHQGCYEGFPGARLGRAKRIGALNTRRQNLCVINRENVWRGW